LLHISLVPPAYLRVLDWYCIAIGFNFTIDFLSLESPIFIALLSRFATQSTSAVSARIFSSVSLPLTYIAFLPLSSSLLSVVAIAPSSTVLLCPYSVQCTSAKGFAFQAPNNIILYSPRVVICAWMGSELLNEELLDTARPFFLGGQISEESCGGGWH